MNRSSEPVYDETTTETIILKSTANSSLEAETKTSFLTATTSSDTHDAGHNVTDYQLCSTSYAGEFAHQQHKKK